jgi:hypothetical protein
MQKWIADFGIKTEDIKNLTVAALLTQLMATTQDGATKSLMNSVLSRARAAGLANAPVSTALESTVVGV